MLLGSIKLVALGCSYEPVRGLTGEMNRCWLIKKSSFNFLIY